MSDHVARLFQGTMILAVIGAILFTIALIVSVIIQNPTSAIIAIVVIMATVLAIYATGYLNERFFGVEFI